MKLKKIASLALAGVMAVSMLAGCAGKTNTNTNPSTEPETPAGVDLAASLSAQVEGVDFTNDSKLASALQQVLNVYGAKAYDSDASTNYRVDEDFETAVLRIADMKSYPAYNNSEFTLQDISGNATWNVDSGWYLLAGTAAYDSVYKTEKGDLDGMTFSYYNVAAYKVGGTDTAADTEAAMVNQFVNELAGTIKTAQLPKVSKDAASEKYEGKYYAYDYTCPVAVSSVKDVDGTTIYFFAYGLNQNVTESSVG